MDKGNVGNDLDSNVIEFDNTNNKPDFHAAYDNNNHIENEKGADIGPKIIEFDHSQQVSDTDDASDNNHFDIEKGAHTGDCRGDTNVAAVGRFFGSERMTVSEEKEKTTEHVMKTVAKFGIKCDGLGKHDENKASPEESVKYVKVKASKYKVIIEFKYIIIHFFKLNLIFTCVLDRTEFSVLCNLVIDNMPVVTESTYSERVSRTLAELGYERTPSQCRERIKRICAGYPQKSEEDIRSSGTGIIVSEEPPYGY
ncbi:hypothetical protein STEG23_007394 [Scotinomys teguina]